MCAPIVIESVRQELSRRGFLSAVAGTLAGTAVADTVSAQSATAQQGGTAQQTQPSARLVGGFRRVFDLTHTYTPKLPIFPAFRPMQIRQRFTVVKDGFYANEITFDEHTGTHMDAPAHFVANAVSADTLSADRLIAPLAVVSIAARAAKDADATLNVDDLLAWEKQHGRLPRGAFVAVHTRWDARIGSPERFLNRDDKGTMHAPGFGEEAAKFLVQQRDIVGVGIDTLSLDTGAAQKFVAHLALLGAGKYGVELMANLSLVPPSGATIIVGAPKHEGASGGPVRVLAVV